MLICQITDTHIKLPGKLAYKKVDTAAMLRVCVAEVQRLNPQPDLIVMTGDLVDLGRPEEYAHLHEIIASLTQPLYVVPGNHDARDPMREAFKAGGYFPASGFLQYAVEDWPLRLIGLDTIIPGQGGGEICAERLAWLDRTLAEQPQRPTLLMMHHPPFITGIGHMDDIGLIGREAFADVVAKHSQIELILCGHLHRTIHARVGGRAVLTSPSPAHQVALDLRDDAPSRFRMEPPGFMLHRWSDGQLISHVAPIGDYPGPFPFFDAHGKLID